MIQITVYNSELLLKLEELPRRVRSALRAKMATIIESLYQDIFKTNPGKFFDKNLIEHGTEELGSSVVGFIEGSDKPGVYSIFPTKARTLRFIGKSGDVVYTKQVLNHPYLKSSPHIAAMLEAKKPWIFDQLEDAMIEAL